MMNCPICKSELIQDLFGLFCPNESCCFISEIPNVANNEGIIPLLYQDKKLIKWMENNYVDKRWYLNGKLHRDDGPAIEYQNGDKYWHLNGALHREDGPAIEYSDGYKEWWINGEMMKRD